jgi:erythromycin esterase-like protein
MGESTHGTEEYYLVRQHLTRFLIEHKNYRVVLIEAEWPDVYIVNQYITTKTGLYSQAKEALSNIQGSLSSLISISLSLSLPLPLP